MTGIEGQERPPGGARKSAGQRKARRKRSAKWRALAAFQLQAEPGHAEAVLFVGTMGVCEGPSPDPPGFGLALRDALEQAHVRTNEHRIRRPRPRRGRRREKAEDPADAPRFALDDGQGSAQTDLAMAKRSPRACRQVKRVRDIKQRPSPKPMPRVRAPKSPTPLARERMRALRQKFRSRPPMELQAVAATAQKPAAGGSSWALPLPKMDEPWVRSASIAPEGASQPSGQAVVIWREGLLAPIEDWLRGSMARLSRMLDRNLRGRAAPKPRVIKPNIPAIARANREIANLRKENESLRLQLKAFEHMRALAEKDPGSRRSRENALA